jgi:hypothetical protein
MGMAGKITCCKNNYFIHWGLVGFFPSQTLKNREMTTFTDALGRLLGFMTLLGGGLLAIAGLACLAVGSYGLFVGFHGGPIVAGLLALFGAALLLVGCLCGHNGFCSLVARGGKRK